MHKMTKCLTTFSIATELQIVLPSMHFWGGRVTQIHRQEKNVFAFGISSPSWPPSFLRLHRPV
jgi:hypothetical protein